MAHIHSFDDFEVSGVIEREYKDGKYCEVVHNDEEADFFSLYGHYKEGGVTCIGDFTTRESAETMASLLKVSSFNPTKEDIDRCTTESKLKRPV